MFVKGKRKDGGMEGRKKEGREGGEKGNRRKEG